MKNLKKIISLMLALALLACAFSACGKKDDRESTKAEETKKQDETKKEETKGSETNAETKAQEQETKEETEAPTEKEYPFDKNDGPLVPYADTLTVTQVRYQNTSTTYVRGEDKSDNFIRDFYKEKLNMEWESLWTTDYGSYFTKLNLDIASNELPDVFMVDGAQLQTLIENGQIEDLTDYYGYYASEQLKNNIEYDNKRALQFPTVDGKLYGIPLTSSYAGKTGFMWIRTDWMKKLGLSAPTTYQEFCDYIKALKESGLCKNNSSGFSFLGAGSVSFDSITQMFGAYYDIFVLDEATGKLTYSGITKEMRNALQALSDMAKAGLIDSDWAAKGSTEEEMISVGQYGIVFGEYFYPGLLNGSLLNDPEADWEAYPLPTLDGTQEVAPKGTNFVNAYVVVRKGYEHPEALLKSMNLWAELWTSGGMYSEWLNERMTTDHKTVKMIGEYGLPYQFDGVLTFNNIGKEVREVLAEENGLEKAKTGTSMTLRFIADHLSDPTNKEYIAGEGWKLYKIYTSAAPVMDTYMGKLIYNEYNGMLSEDAAFNKVTMDKIMVEAYTNIIMGDPIETFDDFVEEWLFEGGEEMLEEVNEWYSKNK